MKPHKRNGTKKRELTHIARQVAAAYQESKSLEDNAYQKLRFSLKWTNYKGFFLYDVGHLNLGEQTILLKTPNNKDSANLEKIAYNSVDIILYKNSPKELAYKLGIEYEKKGFSTHIGETDSRL